MIVVTGGAGFIGANIIHALNSRGETDILVVDDLTDGTRFRNLAELDVTDYMDKGEFLERVKAKALPVGIRAIFHEGACSDTTEWDGKFMMENNYTYSKVLGVSKIVADKAGTLKRYRAAPRGRMAPIIKRSSHITVTVDQGGRSADPADEEQYTVEQECQGKELDQSPGTFGC